MLKNKLDFKLINLAIIVLIITLLYLSKGLWGYIVGKIFSIGFPFLIAFVIAYALYPYVQKLMSHKLSKKVSVGIIVLLILIILGLLITIIFPVLFDQMGSLFNAILIFIKEISMKYNIDITTLQNTLSNFFNEIIKSFSVWVSNGVLTVIATSLSYLSTFIIILAVSIYFLSDMDVIREYLKKFFKKKGKKTYNYVKALDNSMENYLNGFTKIIIISFFEYSIIFLIIGHPNAIMLGFLASISNLIPYFGGVFTNIIALITAFVVSPSLFIKTLIVFLVLSFIDTYVINPYVYGKTNEIRPIIIIFSVFAGGILFGISGIVISLPLAILILTTIKYYKEDILDKIDEIKEKD